MRDQIDHALKDTGADYVEVRIEENAGTRIAYKGRELEDLGRTINRGGSVRALVRGGWGFVSFNELAVAARVRCLRTPPVIGRKGSFLLWRGRAGNRTQTALSGQRVLSPQRLPISPPGHFPKSSTNSR